MNLWSETLHDWKDQRQTVLVFASERDARRFLKHNQIGGDWQTQPYPLATITETCAQNNVACRQIEDSRTDWIGYLDTIDPATGEVRTVAWADRHRPAPAPTYPAQETDPARLRFRMRLLANRIAGVLEEIRLSDSVNLLSETLDSGV